MGINVIFTPRKGQVWGDHPVRPASRDPSARVDTPRPERGVQSVMYRDRNGIFRVASPEAARALDCPPTPRAAMPPPPPFPGARHGIAPTDGRRGGTRAPKIADENLARLLDVFRFWASANAKAESASRLPWAETFAFIASRDAFVEPRPATSEQLKERVRTVANGMARRRGEDDAPGGPLEFIDFFGGAILEPPSWAEALDFASFPFDKPKKTSKRRRIEEEEDDAFDEPADEEFDAIAASPPPAATPPPPTPSSPPAPSPVVVRPPSTPTPTPRQVTSRTPRAARATPATTRRAPRATPAAPRRAAAEEEDAETLAKKERDCLKKGKFEEAREFQARRLGLGEFANSKTPRGFEGVVAILQETEPGWPPSAQYIHKSDVGAITAAWRRLVPVLLQAPEHVGHVAELVEHVVAAFATMRTLKKEGVRGLKREDIRKELVEACECGAFVRLMKLVKKLREEIARQKPQRWEPSVADAELR